MVLAVLNRSAGAEGCTYKQRRLFFGGASHYAVRVTGVSILRRVLTPKLHCPGLTVTIPME